MTAVSISPACATTTSATSRTPSPKSSETNSLDITVARSGFGGSLYLQVLAAILAVVCVGYFFPDFGVKLEPLGLGFIKLIKMLIAPIIFCTVVLGIAGMEDMKKV